MPANSLRPTSEQFRRTCARFATGITVVTTRTVDGTPHGLTANSFTSVSAEPPLVLVCIDERCSILEHFAVAEYFAINVLGEDQQDLSIRFAELPDDRFEGVEWAPGIQGAPLLAGAIALFECKLVQTLEVGDHVILLGSVLAVRNEAGAPLLYLDSSYARVEKD